MGPQLADNEAHPDRMAAAVGARPDRNRRRRAAGYPRRHARAKPGCAAGSMAAAVVIRISQRHDVDDPDGAGAAVASRERGRCHRLHHAGVGVAAGVARSRRADVAHPNPGAADGVRGHRGADGRQRH